MKDSTKIALGVGTLWPILYIIGFFLYIFSQILSLPAGETPSSSGIPLDFAVLFALHFLTILWVWVLVVIYIVNVFRNDRVPQDKKALWAVVIFLGNMIAMPIYWYLYIWREPEEII